MTFIEAYHVGFVVADLDASMQEFTDLVGMRWAAPQSRDMPVRAGEREYRAQFRFSYSTPASGQTLVELIEGPRDTVWWPGDDVSVAFHHLGFWADDLSGDSARLSDHGAALEATRSDGGTIEGFAYHRPRTAPRIELVDVARRPLLLDWLAGGSDFPSA